MKKLTAIILVCISLILVGCNSYGEQYEYQQAQSEQEAEKSVDSAEKAEENEESENQYQDDIKQQALDAYLPKNIYCAVGRTIELYNNQVCLQAERYHMRWNCKIGKAMSRKFSVTGLENQIGKHDLTLEIYDDDLNVLWSGTTVLNIVDNTIEASKSICPIGDSLTNGKAWLSEVMNLSDGKIGFVGTYSGAAKDASGAWQYYSHEGRSGFSAKSYNTATVYSFGGESTPHAFWDGNRFNWNYYKEKSGLEPDAVQIFLGTNGISEDNTDNALNIKKIVDAIRQDDEQIPIFVVNTIYRGTQNGIGNQQSTDGYASEAGAFKYSEDKKVMDLMKKTDELLDAYEGVYMINLALTHDSEYNFGAVETPVNPRAEQTEYLPTESVHPTVEGYYQMADVIYSAYCAAFN